MSTLAATPHPAPLDHNLPCLRCGYNLRTLSSDARCPECSTPIATSLNPSLLRYEDLSWTSILALAFGLMLFSVSLELIYLICMTFLADSERFPDLAQFTDAVHAFTNPLSWLAVYVLGRPNPRPLATPSRKWIRRIMRITAVIALIGTLYLDSASAQLSPRFPYLFNDLPIQQFIELLATIFLYLYLLHLARRTGLPRLLLHTRIAMFAILFALCAWATLDILQDYDWAQKIDLPARLLLMPIFLYQLYLLFLFHRTLRKSAAFAREYWHFCSPVPNARQMETAP